MSYSGKLCLSVSELSYQYPQQNQPVFSQLDFQIYRQQVIGLLGINGCGKSTLLKLLTEQLTPVVGSIQLLFKDYFYLDQIAQACGEIRVELYLLQSIPELAEIYSALTKMEQANFPDPLAYAQLTASFAEMGGYEKLEKIEVILSRLGFPRRVLEQPVNQLSGGERRLLKLASGFVLQPDLYLLDEPTNYLDKKGVEDLIKGIQETSATYLIISHDRWFLDQVTDHILAFNHQSIKLYKGNYTCFRSAYQAEFLARLRKKEKLQKEVNKLKVIERKYKQWSYAKEKTKIGCRGDKGFIGARAAKLNKKAIQAKERIQDRIETLESEKPWIEKEYHLWFEKVEIPVGTCLAVQNLTLSYGSHILFDQLSFSLGWGEKITIKGHNGSGKTSLIKCLIEQSTDHQGEVLWDRKAKIGFLPQYTWLEDTPVRQLFTQEDYQQALTLLACFKVPSEVFWRNLSSLSPGQCRKVQLVKMMMQQPNILILDEPTTHLDYEAIEQLEGMLQAFKGSVILISHDRYLGERTTSRSVDLSR